MNYSVSNLKNGVRVLTIPMPSLESATITVWVKTGSRYEEIRVNGISHFLEHMVFKGSPKYPSAKIVSETIDGMGAENNAGTSKDFTNFWIKTASINLEKAFDILADTVFNPLLKEDEINRERGVIHQEIAMYEDTPIMSIGENFEQLIYSKNPLGWKIAGTEESLKNINHKEFEKYRQATYLPENIMIAVSGGFIPEKISELSEKYFSDLTTSHRKGPKTNFFEKYPVRVEERFSLKNKKTDQAHFVLGFLTEGRGYKGKFAQSVLSSILGKGMSSRLFTEIREKRGLAYSVRSSIDRYQDVGTFDVYAGVTIGKIEEAIKIVIDQLFGLSSKKFKVESKELEKAKSFIKGKLALSLEDSSAVNDFFSEQVLFEKEVLTPKEIYKKLDGVKIDEIYSEAEKLFNQNGIYLTVIGPYNSNAKFVKLLR